jgi:RNA polymerase sigma factor (sigma-70 family)
MSNEPIANERFLRERAMTDRFLEHPSEDSFSGLFKVFTPQLVAFFRARGCEQTLAEDLAQEVMLTVHCKASQIRDRALFRGWLFRIARNTLCRHYSRQTREVETVNLEDSADRLSLASHYAAATLAFEFNHWMGFLDLRESEVMRLRFIEQWKYHEIASAQDIPIGTVQWRVFNAKKKLAPYLTTRSGVIGRAA